MGNQAEKTEKRRVCAGLLAHVDAGKTTLAEGILYLTGRIRSLGRVDHQDAFFDHFELERARGITIFSKQTQAELDSLTLTLLDTPGHVDFSAEMERTLQVLDYAILVISGADGVQSHVETLWRLLARYEIPVFLFVNKMDQPGTDREALMAELKSRLDERCVDFTGESGMKKLGFGADKAAKRTGVPVKDPVSETDGTGSFTETEEFQENLAMCDDELLELYASGEKIKTEQIGQKIASRHVFPCYFGSALRLKGVQELLDGIQRYAVLREYPEEFGARIYKITRDAQGNRLTHMKITGGTLRVKDILTNRKAAATGMEPGAASDGEGQSFWEEKVNQIRILSGENYETVTEAAAGTICAVTGLSFARAGEGLGAEPEAELPVLEPVLSYRVELPEGTDVHRAYRQLKQLEEEEPQLHIAWAAGEGISSAAPGDAPGKETSPHSVRRQDDPSMKVRCAKDGSKETPPHSVRRQDDPSMKVRCAKDGSGEIHVQLMGEVQTEILQVMIRERFGLSVKFGEGSIVYRETIAAPVVGIGHFEPLRHYAEVHLLMEPTERGSGLQFASACGVDELALNWQRLILTHLEEKSHPGVLTGSEITDMKITLVAGRAHLKHTEGGDFRQATYRAVRQGLCRAQSILLEPVYSFRMEVPTESVGRALSDISRMYGSADAPVSLSAAGNGIRADNNAIDMMMISGTAPVVAMRGYQSELLSYTKGRGRLFCTLKGYEECHNAQEVIEARAYDAQADPDNPCGSVFCAHGAGYVVDWRSVPEYAHIEGTEAYAKAACERMRAASAQSIGGTGDAPDQNGEDFTGMPSARDRGVSSGYRFTGYGEEAGITAGSTGQGGSSVSMADDEELRAIFERTYGRKDESLPGKKPKDRKGSAWAGYEDSRSSRRQKPKAETEPVKECLLVDGYNIIFAWEELKELAKTSLEAARGKLLDLMCNYQGYKNNYLIVVFDAYRVVSHTTEVLRYHNIYVVYTKEAETADQYIEKTVRSMDRKYHVTVATSDALEQIIIFGAGASRLSSKGLMEEVRLMQKDLRENYLEAPSKGGKTYLLDGKNNLFL